MYPEYVIEEKTSEQHAGHLKPTSGKAVDRKRGRER